MSFGYWERDRRRQRQQAVWNWLKLLFYAGVLIVSSLFSYQLGVEQWRPREAAQRGEIETLAKERAELQQNLLSLQQAIANARLRADRAEQRYAEDVPTGKLRDLATMAMEKLEEGVPADRLAFVISHASRQRNCKAAESKRFLIQTPLYQGSNTSVAFMDGTLTVTGGGQSAATAEGKAEAWFDPVKPVTIRFTVIGGSQSAAEGQLPLHHSVVIKDTEYRFTITEGSRGFVSITSDACSYP
jgi:hypothetical protein